MFFYAGYPALVQQKGTHQLVIEKLGRVRSISADATHMGS